MLWLYRDALRLRKELAALGAGPDPTWLELGDDVVAFSREPGFVCMVNTGSTPVPLVDGEVVLASVQLTGRELPADAAVWLTRPGQ
jgi:alpha-glucosidase